MSDKQEIIDLLNHALETEHAAYTQYLSQAEIIDGLNAEPIIERLKEIAEDEEGHQSKLRELIGGYLGGIPSKIVDASSLDEVTSIEQILKVSIKREKEAVDMYTEILKKINDSKSELPYEFFKLEHQVRHIIMDEQEHITELNNLLGS